VSWPSCRWDRGHVIAIHVSGIRRDVTVATVVSAGVAAAPSLSPFDLNWRRLPHVTRGRELVRARSRHRSGGANRRSLGVPWGWGTSTPSRVVAEIGRGRPRSAATVRLPRFDMAEADSEQFVVAGPTRGGDIVRIRILRRVAALPVHHEIIVIADGSTDRVHVTESSLGSRGCTAHPAPGEPR